MANEETYLRAILGILARQEFPPDKLAALVGRDKQLAAYNLCDGTRTQTEIAKKLKLDSGNFSRTLGRWAELGLLLKIVDGEEQRPLHLYPLPAQKDGKVKSNG